jgi:hypothetical protein
MWRNTKMICKGCMRVQFAVLLFAVTSAHAAIILSDPFSGSGGDFVDRGFYVTTYPGTKLGTVTLGYNSTVTGTYTTSLTARLNAYDGPILGATQSSTEIINASGGAETLVTYSFGGVAVTPGSLVTFSQSVLSGPGGVFYDLGTVIGPNGLTETNGTTPPLDTFRRDRVGVVITDTTPEPSAFLMMTGAISALIAISMHKKSFSRRP